MSPAMIVRKAAADGVKLTLTPAGTIKAAGDGRTVNRWLAVIREHKAAILDVLRAGAGDTVATPGRSAEDWFASYDERAGIAKFDGGLPRAQAEARAFACCVTEWLKRNPRSGWN